MSNEIVVAIVTVLLGAVIVSNRWPIYRLSRQIDIHDAAIDQIRNDCAHHQAGMAEMRALVSSMKEDLNYIRARLDELRRDGGKHA